MRYSIVYKQDAYDKGLTHEQREFLNDGDNEYANDSLDCKEIILKAKKLKLTINAVWKYRERDGFNLDVTRSYTGHDQLDGEEIDKYIAKEYENKSTIK